VDADILRGLPNARYHGVLNSSPVVKSDRPPSEIDWPTGPTDRQRSKICGLVCPRVHLTSELEEMPLKAKRRSLATPDLTGPWQVSDQSDSEGEEAVRLDRRYVESWSTTMDILILWKTVFAAVRRAGAR
jgi:hypothetical protein